MPGVERASFVDFAPLSGTSNFNDITIEGGDPAKPVNVGTIMVGADYLDAMGIRLLSGRDIGREDVRSATPIVAVNRTLTTVRLSVEQLRRETLPVVDELHRTIITANAELERVDGLLESASSVTQTVDSASHLVYLAFSNPLIKAIAFGAGTSRAARALRRGR